MFIAQKEKPTRGDFVQLVMKDLAMLGLTYEEATQGNMSKKQLKIVANNVALKWLKETLETHSKVKQINYYELQMQPYLKTNLLTTKESNMLTALRSNCVRGIKSNLKKLYKLCLQCPLNCESQNTPEDTQEHIFTCKTLNISTDIKTYDIKLMYGNIEEQSFISKQYCSLMRKRELLLEEQEKVSSSSLPGATFLDLSSQQQQQQGAAAVHFDYVQLQG